MEQIARDHPGKRIEPWFEDEARFGQQGSLARVWARRGSRPRAVKQTGYEWLYVLAMVCPSTGQTVGLLSPYVDAKVMNLFLKQFSQQLSADVQAVLIWDQAGFHKSRELLVPENITILELPAYSPELNPVENLWEYLRSHYWPNPKNRRKYLFDCANISYFARLYALSGIMGKDSFDTLLTEEELSFYPPDHYLGAYQETLFIRVELP